MVMMRTYDTKNGARVATSHANFFVNRELEQTPAYGMQTLFVIGVQSIEDILKYARKYEVQNVYFGTGTTFHPDTDVKFKLYNDLDEALVPWINMIEAVLEEGYFATLDFDFKYINMVNQYDFSVHKNFIPMISLKAMAWDEMNYNTTIKLDDVDFDHSAMGVWCHRLPELLQDQKLTRWHEYAGDFLIRDKNYDKTTETKVSG